MLTGEHGQLSGTGAGGVSFDLDRFVSEHDSALRAQVRRRLPAGHGLELDDVMQRIYLRLLVRVRRDEVRGDDQARSLCLLFARDLRVEHVRSSVRDGRLLARLIADPAVRAATRQHSPEVSRQLLTLVRSALSARQAEVLVLREIEGMSTKDVAAQLGVSQSTVTSTLNGARAALRDAELFRQLGLTPLLAPRVGSWWTRHAAACLSAGALATLSLIAVTPALGRRPVAPPVSRPVPAPAAQPLTVDAAPAAQPPRPPHTHPRRRAPDDTQTWHSRPKLRCVQAISACFDRTGHPHGVYGHSLFVDHEATGRMEIWQAKIPVCDIVDLTPQQDTVGCIRYSPTDPLPTPPGAAAPPRHRAPAGRSWTFPLSLGNVHLPATGQSTPQHQRARS